MKKKNIIEAESSWTDLENCNPIEDMEKALSNLRAQPDFYGKEFGIKSIKNLLPANHPENCDADIKIIQ